MHELRYIQLIPKMIHGVNIMFKKILCVFITFLFCGIVITACGKPKEIKYCNSTSLFGASLSEACELLGIEVDSENYSEAMLAGHNYKIYTPEELYTINGYETSVALYISQLQAPDGQEIGLTMIRFSFEKSVSLDEFSDYLEENYILQNKYGNETEIGWQGEYYFNLDKSDKFVKVYTELYGVKPLIPTWILQLNQVKGNHTELTLICEEAALYRHIDSFD